MNLVKRKEEKKKERKKKKTQNEYNIKHEKEL
jgi:hypothetical protein